MVLSPFDDDDVVPPVSDHVGTLVVVATLVLHLDLIARAFGSVDTHEQDVGA